MHGLLINRVFKVQSTETDMISVLPMKVSTNLNFKNSVNSGYKYYGALHLRKLD